MKSYNNYIINVDTLKQNAKNIKDKVGNRLFCAVVKANAYGTGLHTVCNALNGIADFFACACIKEALEIRTFDKTTKILILGHIDNTEINCIINNNISISVGSMSQLQEIERLAIGKVNVHIQVNTGLNRFGFRSVSEFRKACELIESSNKINLEGVYSHFATKQNDIEYINRQYFRFTQFKKIVKNKDVIFHIANSFATLKSDKYHLDMVRTGFLMYGYTENNIGNNPIVSIKSKVIDIRLVKKGDTVGYDRTYKAEKDMRVGVIPVGYADGFNRRLSNNFNVLINGIKYPIVGLICMDVFMVDLGNDNVKIGDDVILLGKSKNETLHLNDYAKVLNTSPYEILCDFNYRRMNYTVLQNNNTKI